ncbi:MAG TPA: hypothetical protein RMH99_21675 [Sandaracinaceae bacterium LLY-WYZ-13_1]|nr:hypothetical protein [Sandaracinaceae bacterium LLY-WYZ-13_1]
MRTITHALSALALSLAFAGSAAAQDRGADRLAPDTTFDFRDEHVEGGSVGPAGERLLHLDRGARESLVRPRLHFVPEMLKSVETI